MSIHFYLYKVTNTRGDMKNRDHYAFVESHFIMSNKLENLNSRDVVNGRNNFDLCILFTYDEELKILKIYVQFIFFQTRGSIVWNHMIRGKARGVYALKISIYS